LAPCTRVGPGVSQFPDEEFPGVPEVFDRAEPASRLALAAQAVLPSGLLDGVGAPV